MKVVLLFFCIIFVIVLLLLLSSIKLNVKKCNIRNIENNVKREKIKCDFVICIGLYLFGKIKLLNIKISDKLLEKINMKNIEKMDIDFQKSKKFIVLIKKLKINTEKFSMELEIGNDDVNVTAFAVMIISSIVGVALRNCNYKDICFKVVPNFKDTNVIRLNLSGTLSFKIIHIFVSSHL